MRRLTVERVVIDGVPAYVGNRSGSIVAGVSFRVGTADESALDRGLTALIAELAAIDVDDVEFEVGATLTSFVASGPAREVGEALAAVCRALPAFDDDDLTQLADTVLEEPRRLPTIQTTLLGLRFGAQTFGMSAVPPLGLLHLDGERAREWTARFFTRNNAAVWSSGPLHPDIAVPLPAGDRIAPPGLTDPECPLPAWCPNAWVGPLFRDAIDCSIVAPTGDATMVALRAFAAELVERLGEGDLAGVEPLFEIETWSDEITHVALELPTYAHGNDGIECILGSLDDFADLGPDPDELAEAIEQIQSSSADSANAEVIVEMLANDELRSGAPREHDAFLAGIGAVTAGEVAAEFDEMRREIILAAPSDAEIVDSRFALLERSTGFAIEGTTYRRARTTGTPDDDARLTVGPDGVTHASVDEVLTVCFEDCVAAVTYPDHAITLFDIDGTTIELSEGDWLNGEGAFTAIEAALPPGILLEARRALGAREADEPGDGEDEYGAEDEYGDDAEEDGAEGDDV